MAKIGLFYGSSTGKTETAAEAIQAEFGGEDEDNQSELTDSRVKEWVAQLKSEFNI